MSSLFILSTYQALLLATLAAITVLVAAMSAIYRYSLETDIWSALFQIPVIIYSAHMLWAAATIATNRRTAVFSFSAVPLRWIGILAALYAVFLITKKHDWLAGPPALAMILSSSFFDSLWGSYRGELILALFIFIAMWELALFLMTKAQLRNSISKLSIKQSIDQLPDGLLFANQYGKIRLLNERAESLLWRLDLTAEGSFFQLWEQLRTIAKKQDSALQDEDRLYITDTHHRTWQIVRSSITYRTHTWTQLWARDITRNAALTNSLHRQIRNLQENKLALQEMISNLDRIMRQQIILSTRIRIHDVLAQHISIVHRFLEDGIDDIRHLEQLQNLLCDIDKDLHPAEVIDFQQWLEDFRKSCAAVGIAVESKGEFPEDLDVAKTFLALLRESASNIMLHTDASRMHVEFTQNETEYHMIAWNPGVPPAQFKAGNGIKGMRYRIEQLGGRLEVRIDQRFELAATVPIPDKS